MRPTSWSLSKRRSPSPFVAASALAVLLALAPGLQRPASAIDVTEPTKYAAGAAPMGQTNGVVWTTEIAGGHIFAGGKFTSTRPSGAAKGSGETGQAYLAAFDAVTGEPTIGFAPVLENDWDGRAGTVYASVVSPDGNTLYVGGDFNKVNGRRAEHIAAFDTQTGAFLGTPGGGVNGTVRSLAISPAGDRLYAGGYFNRANSQPRTHVAGFNLGDGSLLPLSLSLAGIVDNRSGSYTVRAEALEVSSDGSKLFIAGPFQQVNGSTAQGFTAVDAVTGRTLPGFLREYLSRSEDAWGTSLDVEDGYVYVGVAGLGLDGVAKIDETTGVQAWRETCGGDTYGVLAQNNDVYLAYHARQCANGHPLTDPAAWMAGGALRADNGTPKPWYVQTEGDSSVPDSRFMTRSLSSDGRQLVAAGGFDQVNGKPQANITRFPVGNAAPDRAPWPRVENVRSCTLTACTSRVQITVLEGYDRDDLHLRYEIYRNWSTSAPIAVVDTAEPGICDRVGCQWLGSTLWRTDTFKVTDPGAVKGSQVFYRVKAVDRAGNSVWSVNSNTITVG
jgi:hypothetical protein